MFFNIILEKIQNFLKPLYVNSCILQNIDRLIGLNIFLVIFSSTIANSDNIGYFALFAIMLTAVKLITKTGEKFDISLADKFLLVYFVFVLISVSGSSLFYLSLKGFFKTLTFACDNSFSNGSNYWMIFKLFAFIIKLFFCVLVHDGIFIFV